MKVSIIIPVYNVEQYVERCIKSILDQTMQDYEVIVVNDASPDESIKKITELINEDARFVIINNEQNMGSMWTRMIGYKAAKGDYIVFCDSDDYLPEQAISNLYTAAVNSGADIVAGAYVSITTKGHRAIFQQKLPWGGSDKSSVFKALFTGFINHSLWGKIYKRSLFIEPLDCYKGHTMGEDMILFYQLANRSNETVVDNNIAYYYFSRAGSATRSRHNAVMLQQRLFCLNYIRQFAVTSDELMSAWEHKILKVFHMLLALDYDRHIMLSQMKDRHFVKKLNAMYFFRNLNISTAISMTLLFYVKQYRYVSSQFLHYWATLHD